MHGSRGSLYPPLTSKALTAGEAPDTTAGEAADTVHSQQTENDTVCYPHDVTVLIAASPTSVECRPVLHSTRSKL